MATQTRNAGILYGLLGGLALVVITLGLYIGGVEYFLSPIAFSSYLVIIVIAVMAGIRQKKINGGYLTFSEALKVVFSTFAIAFFISTIFLYVLLNFIDIPFREALAQASLEKSAAMMKSFGMSADQVDKAMRDSANQNNYSIGKMLLGFAMSCIVFFIISLIIAAIIKKKNPVFADTTNQ
jgi:hypothetical protein